MGVLRVRRRKTQGVTLIEMLVVLAIISVSMAVIAPSARAGIAGMKVRSAARKVAALFSSARNTAIRSRKATVVTIDEAARVLSVAQPGRESIGELALDDGIAISMGSPAGEVAANNDRRDKAAATFLFMPDGEVPQVSLELRAERRAIRLTMDALTGALSASEVSE